MSHSIGGSFSMRHGDWKLCRSAAAEAGRPAQKGRKEKNLPPMQLFNLKNDRGEPRTCFPADESKQLSVF